MSKQPFSERSFEIIVASLNKQLPFGKFVVFVFHFEQCKGMDVFKVSISTLGKCSKNLILILVLKMCSKNLVFRNQSKSSRSRL